MVKRSRQPRRTSLQRLVKNKLRVLRAERRWTQQKLAGLVGVSRQTINAIESDRRNPTLRLALNLARAFGKPVENVFSEQTSSEDQR